MSDIPPVALPHPIVDASGPGWAATVTRAPVVGLSAGRAALIADCARAGVQVILATTPEARLTYPLFQLLRSTGAVWLVQHPDGSLAHAVSGEPVAGFADAVDPDAALADLVAPPSAGTPSVRSDDTPWVQFAVSTHHPARAEAVMGGTLEALVDGVAGEVPMRWGTAEPVVLDWDRVALTGVARHRMPQESRFVVAGGGDIRFRGTVVVARSSIGITEETRVVFAGVGGHGLDADRTAALLARIAERQQVLLGSAWDSRGHPDGAIPSGRELYPQPVAAVIGARAARTLELDELAPRLPEARRIGGRRTASYVMSFGGDETAWRRFRSAVVDIGIPEIMAALTPPDIRPTGGRHAS